ncbi:MULTISPECIES: chemotaxis protein CheW [Stenotrophomonas]|jgi:purine-binding chemotaxis protein CheW|uniref:chemotaxis protein CheW n=1 Tax=Stenotrophomonas TaxID=40323 RepID=UPI0024DE4E4C|nr:chemotaxis protein CheW [Stenotrophomonas sp. BIO128-Bstrain]WIA63118.1 chemotaxis protein CheW [Stenotrophomonas sp. BIO128-Bstrain]
MNTAGVLDDYLEQLLGDAMPPPAASPVAVATADTVEATGGLDAAPATVETASADAAPATDEQTAAGTAPAADDPVVPPGFSDLLDELRDDPLLSGAMTLPTAGAALDAEAASAAISAPAPGFDDLLDELRNDPLLSGAMPAPAEEARPSWDDLPPEVVYETDPMPAGASTPAELSAPVAPVARAPIARQMPSMPPMPAATSARAGTPSLAQSRPGSWEELQRQARDPASSPRENRRASERTSRWLRLRCGAQAYALELLKVQEVVLPVPLLPLRGTSPAMLGIMNLRGQVVPVMDLGLHLGSSAAGNDANTRIVVLEENGETMGLRVSAVEDVANLTDSQIEPPDTARICQISNDLFRGVARCGAQPMILLDATQLLN